MSKAFSARHGILSNRRYRKPVTLHCCRRFESMQNSCACALHWTQVMIRRGRLAFVAGGALTAVAFPHYALRPQATRCTSGGAHGLGAWGKVAVTDRGHKHRRAVEC